MRVEKTMFQDRRDAGRAVARAVAALGDLGDAVVLALPRGGVPVAYEVARACSLPLDVLLVRKLGAPHQRELAVGAVASGGVVVLNPEIVSGLHITEPMLQSAIAGEQAQIERQERIYRLSRPAQPINNRTVILVDDGLATGATMRAAIQAVRPRASRVIVAVPVGPPSLCEELAEEADRVVCVETPEPLEAVGLYYRDFEQTTDDEVRALLTAAARAQDQRN
jgi:putative phosphoribosyl transferase